MDVTSGENHMDVTSEKIHMDVTSEKIHMDIGYIGGNHRVVTSNKN